MRQLITWLLLCGVVFGQDAMPLPWTRELELSDSGSDVLIMQALLMRSPGVASIIATDGDFGSSTQAAVESFQVYTMLNASGIFDIPTAQALLACCERDGYRDNGTAASGYGKLYKIVVPLPSLNRSVEATATLLDKDNNFIRSFTVRTHGHRDDGSAVRSFPARLLYHMT
jgi:peptidoglycan hydrolase-like protein with peptidoglycan-binding domain